MMTSFLQICKMDCGFSTRFTSVLSEAEGQTSRPLAIRLGSNHQLSRQPVSLKTAQKGLEKYLAMDK